MRKAVPQSRELREFCFQGSRTQTHKTLAWTVLGGVGLGLIGCGYSWLVMQFAAPVETFFKMKEHLALHHDERRWMFVMAVCFAPLAEEVLFRGLLYRALDREWGGWQAMAASALFFAIYHPPLAWVPVSMVGFFNAWLFKRSRRLLPCIWVHAIYNAIIVWFT